MVSRALKLMMGWVGIASVGPWVMAQEMPLEPAVRFVGEVTGNDVYIRSGPSANYYPVTKVNAGTTVKVYGEEDSWYAIEPPADCFSVIHKKFVDIGESPSKGVVNGNAVRVRAGSLLRPDLYAKQLKLDRGAEVTVLGPHNDDYLRITPPPGAKLYIHRDFVSQSRDAADSATPPTPNEPATVVNAQSKLPPSESRSKPDDDTPTEPSREDDGSKVADSENDAGDESTIYRDEIKELDDALAAEMREPLMHRDYDSLIARYGVLAEQDVDAFAKAYATARIAQLEQAEDGLEAVRELNDLSIRTKQERARKLLERNRNRLREKNIGGGFDAIGELRRSMIWSSPVGPVRYRLVGKDGEPRRTLGYVEIPSQLNVDVNEFLGRWVGVRAAKKHVETRDVTPIVVYVASELVVLDGPPETPSPQADANRSNATNG